MCVRYIDNDLIVYEHLLDLVALGSLKADVIAESLLYVLNNTVGTDKLVAQSYDGASVMSSSRGGVQKLVYDSIGKNNIRCFAHRLHLVVLKVLQASKHVEWVLDVCEQLHNLFRRYAVSPKNSETGGHT